MNLLELPLGDQASEVITAVIEIPKGSVNKYEFDKALHVFRLDRHLHSPVHYPGDYGFIPRALAEDGDPLDILVFGDSPTFPSCVYAARVLGLFEVLDQGIPDQKVVACATGNPRFHDVSNHFELQPHLLREVEHFFSVYKGLEGKRTKALGWKGRAEAIAIIDTCHLRYSRRLMVPR